MSQDPHPISTSETINTLIRMCWPVVKVKVTDTLQHEDIPLGDTIYKLRIDEIDLHNTTVELVDFISVGTRAQNDVLIPKKVITTKNPFLNWTPQDVGRWVTTLGSGNPWDNYELLIMRANISGMNLTTITLHELEAIGIEKRHAEMILFARDKILGLNTRGSFNNNNDNNNNNEFDLHNMVESSISNVANVHKFQYPMDTWSVSTVQEWINYLTHSNANNSWKRCFDIIDDHNIDGKTFQDVHENTLIQYGMDEDYAAALIQARDKFLQNSKTSSQDEHHHHHHLPHIPHVHHHHDESTEDTSTTITKENTNNTNEHEHEHRLTYEVGIFEFAIRLHGPLRLRLKVMANEELVPDCAVDVKDVDFSAKLQIEFDIVRNIIQLCFLEKPKIKTDMDVKIKLGITIPLIGEDFFGFLL